ncbi:hypothetical protein GH714_042458 [Hevea brasiliensis]|uniref:HhH-GPD domain-containing protein n=1 Tax=Hevea brasiliensis TaxID=3981 RepID=A0A6A6KTU6_HEVBR|nr:hypothetical protein GH714_042458 [Hevea brasiliensis]
MKRKELDDVNADFSDSSVLSCSKDSPTGASRIRFGITADGGGRTGGYSSVGGFYWWRRGEGCSKPYPAYESAAGKISIAVLEVWNFLLSTFQAKGNLEEQVLENGNEKPHSRDQKEVLKKVPREEEAADSSMTNSKDGQNKSLRKTKTSCQGAGLTVNVSPYLDKVPKEEKESADSSLTDSNGGQKKSSNKSKKASEKAGIAVRNVFPYFQKVTKEEGAADSSMTNSKDGQNKLSRKTKKSCQRAGLTKSKKASERAGIAVRNVSPYFQKVPKEGAADSNLTDSNCGQKKSSKKRKKPCEGAGLAFPNVLPHFQKICKEEEAAHNSLTDCNDGQKELSKKSIRPCKRAGLAVRVVSPCFCKVPKEGEAACSNLTASHSGQKGSSKKSKKPCERAAPAVRTVSPYFQKVPKEKEAADSSLNDAKHGRKKSSKMGKRSGSISNVLSSSQKRSEAYRSKTPDNTWKPPRSEVGLLQEDHVHDPWRVLVICMLLNCTTGTQVRRVITDFFTLCPDPMTATEVKTQEIENIIEPLGLHRKRVVMIQRLSQEYLGDDWTYVTQPHGVGKDDAALIVDTRGAPTVQASLVFSTGEWINL